MAVKIILKNSSNEDKRPTPTQLDNGEIALNYNAAGAFLTCKDTDGNIQQVGGVKISETAPDSPVKQTLWFQPSSFTLAVYDGDSFLPIAGGGDGGGGTPGGGVVSIVGDEGIEATNNNGLVTLDVDLHGGDDGLEIRDSKLKASVASASQLGSVKIGEGIDVDSTGTISVDIPQTLNFRGSVDLNNPPTGQINPNPPELGDTYANTVLANPVDNGWTGIGGEVSQAGDLVVWDGNEWEIIGTGGTPDVDLDYRAAQNNGTVTNTAGDDAVLPIAVAADSNASPPTAGFAGLFTGGEKEKLANIQDGATNEGTNDGRYLRTDDQAGDQTVQSTGKTTFSGNLKVLDKFEVFENGNVLGRDASGNINIQLNATDGFARFGNTSQKTIAISSDASTSQVIDESSGSGVFFLDPGVLIESNASASSSSTDGYGILLTGEFAGAPGKTKSGIFCSLNVDNAAGKSDFYQGLRIDGENLPGNSFDKISYGVRVTEVEDTAPITYSFHTDAVKGGNQNYSFYAEGDAPNFFKGDTYIGGSTSRNTRQLWESTLTEEQKEQLTAGTLAIPANVSTPGDGSFARQWWYDQQSEEDQALIDAGELDYPEYLQAANFVDTFDLSDTTNIWLFDGGSAAFAKFVDVGKKGNSFVRFGRPSDNSPFASIGFDTKFASASENGKFGLKNLSGSGDICLASNQGKVSIQQIPTDGSNYKEVASIDKDGLGEFSGGVNVTGGDLLIADGKVGMSTPAEESINIFIKTIATGNTIAYGIANDSLIENDVTSSFRNYWSNPRYSISSFNIDEVVHFGANQSAFPAGVTVDKQIGFYATSTIRNASENYGFFSEIPAGTDTFNFYAEGNAPNYFNGDLLMGAVGLTKGDVLTGVKTGFFTSGAGELGVSRSSANTPGAVRLSRGGGVNGRSFIDFFDTNTELGNITTDGATVSFNETSDYRVKANIQPLPSAVDTIKAIKPVTFEYTDRNVGQTYKGFVAHELQEAGVTEAVRGTKDATEAIGTLADYDGTVLETDVTEPDASELEYTEEVETDGVATMVTRTRTWTPTGTRPVYQGVDQTKLIPLLTKALQECLERIETLEALVGN
jgi:hypothetical protein